MPLFRSRHLALNSPLGHIFTRPHTSLPKSPDTQNSRWLQSLFPPTATLAFAKLRRTQSLARPTIRAAFSQIYHISISSLYSQPFLRDLQHKKQTQYAMLQIKTILKHISTSYILKLLSFIYPISISEEFNVNTHTHVTTIPR